MASQTTQTSKKSLFKHPTFRRPVVVKTAQDDVTEIDLFTRSNSTYLPVVEERERKLERKAAKAAQRNEELSKQGLTDLGLKRQRSISTSDSSSENESEAERKSSQTRSSPYSPPQSKRVYKPHVNSATRGQETIGDSTREIYKPVGGGSGGDDDDELILVSVASTARADPDDPNDPTEDDEEEESDIELAELARQARESAKLKREASQSAHQDRVHSFAGDTSLVEIDTLEGQAVSKATVLVSVSSPLPGVETRGFKISLQKPLGKVRIAWCKGNGFTQEEAQDIVLIFKGQRVFDLNSPKFLGISVDEEGNAQVEGGDSDLIDEDGQVIMLAIHETDVDKYTKKHEIHAQDSSQISVPEEIHEPPPAPTQDTSIKIICRAKGLKDFKIVVKSHSSIAQLEWAFILYHRLHKDSEANVLFDGEILAGETTMAELDIEDMDIFDVQVNSVQALPSVE